jgi:hypothetical protein
MDAEDVVLVVRVVKHKFKEAGSAKRWEDGDCVGNELAQLCCNAFRLDAFAVHLNRFQVLFAFLADGRCSGDALLWRCGFFLRESAEEGRKTDLLLSRGVLSIELEPRQSSALGIDVLNGKEKKKKKRKSELDVSVLLSCSQGQKTALERLAMRFSCSAVPAQGSCQFPPSAEIRKKKKKNQNV